MAWLRIGRLELYKIPASLFVDIDCICGCRLVGVGVLGMTWLGSECRETQGSEFIKVYRSGD